MGSVGMTAPGAEEIREDLRAELVARDEKENEIARLEDRITTLDGEVEVLTRSIRRLRESLYELTGSASA